MTSPYTIFYLHRMNVETTVSVQCKKKFYLTADDSTGISLIFYNEGKCSKPFNGCNVVSSTWHFANFNFCQMLFCQLQYMNLKSKAKYLNWEPTPQLTQLHIFKRTWQTCIWWNDKVDEIASWWKGKLIK